MVDRLIDTNVLLLGAVCKARGQDFQFENYIIPSCPISDGASKVNGLYKRSNRLVDQNGRIMDTVSPQQGLNDFANWIEQLSNTANCNYYLVAHNNHKYDQVVLSRNMARYGMQIPDNWNFADSNHVIDKIREIGKDNAVLARNQLKNGFKASRTRLFFIFWF